MTLGDAPQEVLQLLFSSRRASWRRKEGKGGGSGGQESFQEMAQMGFDLERPMGPTPPAPDCPGSAVGRDAVLGARLGLLIRHVRFAKA